MRNAFSGINKEIMEYIGLAFVFIIGAMIIGAVVNLAPTNPAIQSLAGTYNFVVKLLLDWGSPDPVLLSLHLIIGAAIVTCLYGKSKELFNY